jgi:16S rRNA (cytidine1402-2'-O)-methyltransferase
MPDGAGTLYVVATPIGNLDDISLRARKVLAEVDLVAAEDTRRSGKLLDMLGIRNRLISCHEHNEAERVPELLERLARGESIALVSDAGTPLVSDPGFRLVSAAAEAGADIRPIPGCSAAIAAVSVAGLPTDQLLFVGFLPSTAKKREARLEALKTSQATLIIYEAVHRVSATLEALEAMFGADRKMLAAREITKLHECFYRGTIAEVREQIAADAGGNKGEFTLVVKGAEQAGPDDADLDRTLKILIGYLGVRQAADAAAKILGTKKNAAYKRALELRESTDGEY